MPRPSDGAPLRGGEGADEDVSMSVPHGSEIGFVTGDADRLVRFYVDAFGFEVERVLEFPQGAVHRLRAGAVACKIFQPAGGVEPRGAADPWHRFGATMYGALHVGDASAVEARAIAQGARVIMPVTSHRPGAKAGLVADPDGNVWELLEESSTEQAHNADRRESTGSMRAAPTAG